MDTKKILEFEKKIATMPAKIVSVSNPGLGKVLAAVPEKVFDGLISMQESSQKVNAQKLPGFWRNLWGTLLSEKAGEILVLGPSQSGKTTLFQSAEQVFKLDNREYSCKKQYQNSAFPTGRTPFNGNRYKKWTTGRFIISDGEKSVSFYTTTDRSGDKSGQTDTLNYLENAPAVVVFCFNLEWLYDNERIPITDKEKVSLSEYLRIWTKILLAYLKYLKKSKKKFSNMQIVYFATHADTCVQEDESSIRKKIGFDHCLQYTKSEDNNQSIRCKFVVGSFDTYENTKNTWVHLMDAFCQA